MHQIASQISKISRHADGEGDTHPWGGGHPLRFAPGLVVFGHSMVTPPDSFILPSETNGWITLPSMQPRIVSVIYR